MAKRVLILGAGYGGLQAALETRRMFTVEGAQITLVDRHPFHQLVTELHQPAAGSVQDRHVKIPLNSLLKGKNIDLILGEVKSIHSNEQHVHLVDGSKLEYDLLVVGLGSETEFFGIPGLQEYSFVLKSVEHAQRIREHISTCIEQYKQTNDRSFLTFVVGGAGLTGIELIGEFADMLPILCKQVGVDPSLVELLSVEAAPSILPGFPEDLVDRARKSLESRNVQFVTGQPIVQMEEGVAHLKDGRSIHTKTLVWTGGVRGNTIVANSGLEVDRRGRAMVNEHLQSVSDPHVFVVGDSALVMSPEGRPYPPTAQLAGQMGVHVGRQIFALAKGSALDSFAPHFSGTLASLGRKDAIGMVGDKKRKVTGKPASVLKLGSKLRWLYNIGGLFTRAK